MLAAEEDLLGQAATGAGTDFTGRFAGGGGLDADREVCSAWSAKGKVNQLR